MYNYLISNRELIFAILIASIRAVLEGALVLGTIQTLVYQITKLLNGKGFSIFNFTVNRLEKFIYEGR